MKVIGYALALAMAGAPVTLAPDRTEPAAKPKPTKTRPAALAGTWYPDGRAALVASAELLMRVGAPLDRLPSAPRALVVPHAGWSYSGPVAGAAFRVLRPGDFERVVVMGPSHHAAFRGYALDERGYRTPAGDVPPCAGALDVLRGPETPSVPEAFDPEHSIEIELPFLQTALGRFCLVPILVGDTNEELERAFAGRLAKLDDGRTLFVFSSDLSHYGPRFDYEPFGKLSADVRGKVQAMNARALALVAAGDAAGFRGYLRETGNTICGRNGLLTLLELLARDRGKPTGVILGHYASADIPGQQDDSSVSYGAIAFLGPGAIPPAFSPLAAPPRLEDPPPDTPALGADDGARLVRLARAALEAQLRGGDSLRHELAAWPSGRDEERRRGVFVTLNRRDADEARRLGRLRGCIGQPEPTYPLYFGTVQAAVDAALHDPRFEPVQADELARLEIEVTVLSPRRPIASYREIRIGTHGVVLQKGGQAALFLPQVAPEQGWNVEQMLTALAEKAGLPADAWREGARLSVFTGQVFEERR